MRSVGWLSRFDGIVQSRGNCVTQMQFPRARHYGPRRIALVNESRWMAFLVCWQCAITWALCYATTIAVTICVMVEIHLRAISTRPNQAHAPSWVRTVELQPLTSIADLLEARFSFIVPPCLTSLAVMARESIWGQGAADVVGASPHGHPPRHVRSPCLAEAGASEARGPRK